MTLNFNYIYKTLQSHPKYEFSRSEWYVVDVFDKNIDILEARAWCTQLFGKMDRYPSAWSRWINFQTSIFRFRDKADAALFKMKWL